MSPYTKNTSAQSPEQLKLERETDLFNRSHALKQCDYKNHKAEAISGIAFKGKWICGKCWPSFSKKKKAFSK